MQRHNFYLGPVTISLLRGHAKKEGVSMSEILRRAIEQYQSAKPNKGVKP